MKLNIRVYSATKIYFELEKYGVADDKMLDTAEFLKANNENADAFFGCPDRSNINGWHVMDFRC
jgi:hypothetical protein